MLIPFEGKLPIIGKDVFIAASAAVIGNVTIGDRCSIWFQAVIRGDLLPITVGTETNIQDSCVLHITHPDLPCRVGSRVTMGHGAIVHACTIEDECLIGMGAIILDGAIVEQHSLVAAGSVVKPGFRVKSGQLVAGNPAEFKRTLSTKEIESILWSAEEYVKLGAEFRGK